MVCKNCGTEIADKALICYRCGASVYEAVHQPAPLKKKRSWVVYLVFVILVLLAAVLLWLR